jgi:hypothetical protein
MLARESLHSCTSFVSNARCYITYSRCLPRNEFIIRSVQCVEVSTKTWAMLAHPRTTMATKQATCKSNNVHSDFSRPVVDFNNPLSMSCLELRGWFRILMDLCCNAPTEIRCLRPEDRNQFLDMTEAECWRNMLSLEFVLIALHQNQSISQNDSQKSANVFRLLKVVTFVYQDVGECCRIGR